MDNEVDLGSVTMKGINFHLKTYKGDKDDNLTIFTDKFEDDNPRDSTTNQFLLRTSNIYLEDITFRQENENDEVPLAFAAYNGGGSLRDFKILGPNVSTKIRGLYFTDNRGLEVSLVFQQISLILEKVCCLKIQLLKHQTHKIKADNQILL